jgi:excisionase family DNA binding protein
MEDKYKDMLTVSEMGRLFHVSDTTIRRRADKGIIKAYRVGPRRFRRFKPEDVAALLLKEQEVRND